MTLDDLIALLPADPPPIRPGETTASLPAVVLRDRGLEIQPGGRYTHRAMSIHVLVPALPYVTRHDELMGLTLGILGSLAGSNVQIVASIPLAANIDDEDSTTPDNLEHQIDIAFTGDAWPTT